MYKYVECMYKNNKKTTKTHLKVKKYKHIDEKRYINRLLFVDMYKNKIIDKNALTMHKNKRTIQP